MILSWTNNYFVKFIFFVLYFSALLKFSQEFGQKNIPNFWIIAALGLIPALVAMFLFEKKSPVRVFCVYVITILVGVCISEIYFYYIQDEARKNIRAAMDMTRIYGPPSMNTATTFLVHAAVSTHGSATVNVKHVVNDHA